VEKPLLITLIKRADGQTKEEARALLHAAACYYGTSQEQLIVDLVDLGDCGAGRARDIIILLSGLRNQQPIVDAVTSAPANLLGG